MSIALPYHPDIRRRLKQRLLALPPRAFELFAGDLLVYIGLQKVAVTRYIGDGGIDAHGDLVATSNLVRVPTGVQVKRHRHNVQRPDIDRFIGALGGNFRHGIFITTAGYAPKAREKAGSSPVVSIDTVDGDQVAALMVQHPLDRFLIKGFLEYDANSGVVRFAPQLWNELRLYETLDVQQSADQQLAYYYSRTR